LVLALTRKREGGEEGKKGKGEWSGKMEMGERLSPEERGEGGKRKAFSPGKSGEKKKKKGSGAVTGREREGERERERCE
jgi:hypothetical protein